MLLLFYFKQRLMSLIGEEEYSSLSCSMFKEFPNMDAALLSLKAGDINVSRCTSGADRLVITIPFTQGPS